ncbi:MAG: methyl-accepting chemotaxis protein [Pseudomonadota bacterium]
MPGAARRDRSKRSEALTGIDQFSPSVRLVALNASVEAARAGDAGRWISVSVQEIKMLAEGIKKTTDRARDQIAALTI